MLAVKIWKDGQKPPDPGNAVMVVEHDYQGFTPRYEVILTKDGTVHTGIVFKTIIEDAVEAAGEDAERPGIDTTVYLKPI
ncbi:hypothetical protein [Methylobacterium nodulans]|uniref:Uncharacterized protein n=1 Tax=Methylobacterium nodulans (strain LMG 21967 / CNCM I-2342 / ORS 2060) TaxID=460265 RepID=B8IWG8_METNO|nr:hypothetical protein [Methylobacterium nodulans]ACL62758.1 hypothetical protein Mnod_8697 [Methylobacterium nodulans ORS 2060]